MEKNKQNIELNIQNLNVDKSIQDILLHLAQAIKTEITDLEARVNYLEAKSNALERYRSKDTIKIKKKHLPTSYQKSLLNDAIYTSMKLVFHMDLRPRNIKACHPLGLCRDFLNSLLQSSSCLCNEHHENGGKFS